jgi:hypothetical protein
MSFFHNSVLIFGGGYYYFSKEGDFSDNDPKEELIIYVSL